MSRTVEDGTHAIARQVVCEKQSRKALRSARKKRARKSLANPCVKLELEALSVSEFFQGAKATGGPGFTK
jgi:hypothetical protein